MGEGKRACTYMCMYRVKELLWGVSFRSQPCWDRSLLFLLHCILRLTGLSASGWVSWFCLISHDCNVGLQMCVTESGFFPGIKPRLSDIHGKCTYWAVSTVSCCILISGFTYYCCLQKLHCFLHVKLVSCHLSGISCSRRQSL